MRNHKHSPAPWREDGELILAADDTAILTLDPYGAQDEETLYANGYLVRGAPTLLEAADAVLDHYDHLGSTFSSGLWKVRIHDLRKAVAGCTEPRP